MKPTPRHIDLMAMALIAVVLVMGGGLSIKLVTETRQKKLETQRLVSMYTGQMAQAGEKLAGLEAVLTRRQTDLAMAAKLIPETLDMGGLLSAIQQLADTGGAALTDFSHGDPSDIGRYRQVAVKLCLEGAFPDLYPVIRGLETMDRLVVIEGLQMDQTPEGACRALINAHIFFGG